MNALIVGGRGVGKSTLIQTVLKELACPFTGYETRKEDSLSDTIHGSPVYIYEAGKPHIQSPENLLGYCKDRHPEVYAAAFARYAPKLLEMQTDGVIVMDEIGFMESASDLFCHAVLTRLDGQTPVLAAVKHNDTPFLNAVRAHKNCRCFFITEENRDTLFEQVLGFMRCQLPKQRENF